MYYILSVNTYFLKSRCIPAIRIYVSLDSHHVNLSLSHKGSSTMQVLSLSIKLLPRILVRIRNSKYNPVGTCYALNTGNFLYFENNSCFTDLCVPCIMLITYKLCFVFIVATEFFLS